MLLQADLHLRPFDEQRWVINTRTEHNLLVNKATADLCRILRASATLDQACAQFNCEFATAMSGEAFARLLTQRLGGYGILADDPTLPKAQLTQTYIALKVELLPAAVAARCARPLQPLYAPRLFWLLFVGLLLGALGLGIGPSRFGPAPGLADWLAAPLIYLSVFVHEFGHIAACGRYGFRHGGIGFGFYGFLFPVFYADVSSIWLGTRQQRVITNLGGITSQLLYANLLAAGYWLTHYHALLVAALAVTLLALWQLNPFVRHDGYWLLVDLTNTPNLLEKATRAVWHTFSRRELGRLVRSRGRGLTRRQGLLVLYGLANASLFALFTAYLLASYGALVVRFPLLIVALSQKLASGTLVAADLKQEYAAIGLFYVLLAKFLYAKSSRLRKKIKGSAGGVK